MLRLPHRLAAVLLWLGIALLPLRGAAEVLMPVLMMHSAPAAVASVVEADEAAMPCHASPALTVDAADSSSHACALCDLCHSAAVQAPSPPVLAAPLPDGPPQARASAAVEPRASDGLFRPPRSHPA